MRGRQARMLFGQESGFQRMGLPREIQSLELESLLYSQGSRKIAFGNRLLTNGRTRLVNLHILLFMTPGLKELE